MFFNNYKNRFSLATVNRYRSTDQIYFLQKQLQKIDKEIADVTRALLEAQVVKVRSMFSSNNNFIQEIQQKMVQSTVNNSFIWHQRKLLELNKEKSLLQNKLDRLTGQLWPKRFKKIFLWILLVSSFIVVIGVLLMGLIAAIYFLPILIITTIGILFIRKLSRKHLL